MLYQPAKGRSKKIYRTLLIAFAAAASILLAACNGGGAEQTPTPTVTPAPLAGAVLSCKDAGPGELIACNEERGIALTYVEEAYRLEGLEPEKVKVNQYVLTPLRVTSVEDLRGKRDWAWTKWDVWGKEEIDICEVKLSVQPESLMLQLEAPEDFLPPRCLVNP